MEDSKRKLIITVIVLVTVTFLISVGWYLFRTTRFEFGYGKLKIGDTKEQVLDLMGRESTKKRCNSEIRQKRKDVACYEISAYYSLSSYWAIAFDENGKVVKKYYWTFDDGYGKPNEIDMVF